jgi:hypothetical protein
MADSEAQSSPLRLQRLFDLLQPVDGERYEKTAQRLKEARNLLHVEISRQVEIPLNKKLASMPLATVSERQELSRWLANETRNIGIAVKCPRTGAPASLHIDSGYSPAGRFQVLLLQDRSRIRTASSVTLPHLQFCVHPIRREPLAEYWARRAVVQNRDRER